MGPAQLFDFNLMPFNSRVSAVDSCDHLITIYIDGHAVQACAGESIAAALLAAGRRVFRHTSKTDAPRGLFCGIGVCHDCLVTVNGRAHVRACVTPVAENMRVVTEKSQQPWPDVDGDEPAASKRDVTAEVAVVGAGPAGLEAALAAAEAGVQVILLDSAPQVGGQYFKRPSRATESIRRNEVFTPLFRRLQQAAALRVLTDTLVWGAFPDEDGWLLTLHGPEAPVRLHARTLILAPGAYDRPIAFPGWTLPGVMTAGGVQTLLKSQGILPGQRFVLAGAGPLQWVLAAHLVEAGAEVLAVLEATPLARLLRLRHLPALWGQAERLQEGWRAWRTLRWARVPMRLGWGVIRAQGGDEVEAVTIAPLDDQWRPQPLRAETLIADTLVIGYGFLSSTQLTRLLGCIHDYEPRQGGWIPRRDAWMQTSLPGVFAVGDGAGVGGALLARLEGRIAGLRAAHDVGRVDANALTASTRNLWGPLRREQRFATLLGELFTPEPGIYTLASDDTLICRCEEVRLRDIRKARAAGAKTLNEIKGLTRAGMGRCQGRICGPLAAQALTENTSSDRNQSVQELGMLSVRPPIFPLTVAELAQASPQNKINSNSNPEMTHLKHTPHSP